MSEKKEIDDADAMVRTWGVRNLGVLNQFEKSFLKNCPSISCAIMQNRFRIKDLEKMFLELDKERQDEMVKILAEFLSENSTKGIAFSRARAEEFLKNQGYLK